MNHFEIFGLKPGVDIVCVPYPGSEKAFLFNSDQFAMFSLVAIESALFFGRRGVVALAPPYIAVMVFYYWERAEFFGSVPSEVFGSVAEPQRCGSTGLPSVPMIEPASTIV